MEREKTKNAIVRISCAICLITEGSPSPWSLPTIADEGIALRMKEQHIKELGHVEAIQIVPVEEEGSK